MSARTLSRFLPLVLSILSLAGPSRAAMDYDELARSVDEARIRHTIETLSGVGSRVVGYPGAAQARQYLLDQFGDIGLQDVRAEDFMVTVPVDKGATLTIPLVGQMDLHSLWPNLVRTSTLSRDGLTGRLLYAGSGRFGDFNGKHVDGAIVLMDFNTGSNWLNAAMLGAKAVLFIAPDSTASFEAEGKFLQVPQSTPRFWIARKDAQALLDYLTRGDLEVTLHARMDWEQVPAANILGAIPGVDPKLRHDIVVVEAYYDAMSVVPALAPGAEMACGIASLLEIAHYLHQHPPARTVLFLATSAHHMGLRGVDAFLQRHARGGVADFMDLEPFTNWITEPINVKLFIALDLSSRTDELGVWNSSTSFYYKRYFAPFGKNFMNYAAQVAQGLGYVKTDAMVNGISPEGGMGWETFVPGRIAVDGEIALSAGIPALSFVTVNDVRLLVDTPLDTPDRVNYANLTRQARLLAGVFRMGLDDPLLFPDFQMRLKDNLLTLDARVTSFPRRSIVPDMPRKGAVAVLLVGQPKSAKGVRGDLFELTDDDGRFQISRIRVGSVELQAYGLDPENGDVVYAPDQGVQGSQLYPMRFTIDWRYKEWMIVLFPCIATDFYDIIDPRYLTKLSTLTVFDETNSTPAEFGYAVGSGGPDAAEPCGVVFTRPGTRVKLALSSGVIGIRYLLLNSRSSDTEEQARGEGFLTQKAGSFARTSFQAARDMWNLDEARIRQLARYSIENNRLNELHAKARECLQLARNAEEALNWEDFVKYTRAALGIESRAYPDVKATQNDVIKGMIFYLALLLPCAYFAERLLFAFAQIQKQILGFLGIFLVIFAVMGLVHPAFHLSNPVVILLAFIILALAVLVMSIITTKFNEQMKKMRTDTAVVHDTDVGRISASYAAFSLGISNMKKRKVRTVLTFVTLLLLTFTVLSFTSIKSQLRYNQISRDNRGLYQGALIRSRSWNALEEAAYEYALSDFGDIASVAPRSWYISKAKNYIKVKSGSRSANALGVLGLTPQEAQVTGIDACLSAGSWFEPGEEAVCILSDDMAIRADLLGLTVDDVGKQYVRIFGERLLVKGIFDSKKLKALRDLDDEILTPADFQLTGGQAVQDIAKEEEREKTGLEDPKIVIKPFVHLEPANIIILPYDLLRRVGGALESVAVRFDEGVDERSQIERFITRLALTLFAGIQEEGDEDIRVSVYSSLGLVSVKGLANLLIPILIAALIVLNTMMGSVYERFREIGIYSSVGLAPVHIAFLFMAESCVYAVLGTVAGYLVGQVVAKVLILGGWLTGFTLNYSSLSAVSAAFLVIAVVLLSTVYPARKASQMAVPDVSRKWKLPEPDGDHWQFDFPFTVGAQEVLGLSVFLIGYFDSYSEESVGTFYTDGARLGGFDTENGQGYTIEMNVWLAPFDLGVSQHVLFRAVPMAEHRVYGIQLTIERLSGEDASWKRVNQRFMNVIRKQFLIWRTIAPSAKLEYRQQGADLLTKQHLTVPA